MDGKDDVACSSSGSASSSVSSGMHLMFSISRLFGVAPVSFSTTRKGNRTVVRMSRYQALYGYILNTITCVLSLIWLYIDCKDQSIASTIIFMLDILVVITMSSISVYGGFGRMTRMLHNLNKLNKITSRLISINYDKIKSSEEKEKKIFILVLGSYIILMGSTCIVMVMRYQFPVFISVYIVQSFMFVLVELQIILLIRVSAVGTALMAILIQLQNISSLVDKGNINTPNLIYSKNSHVERKKKFQRICDSYDVVCEVVNSMNETEGVLLLIIYTSFTIYLLLGMYNILEEIFLTHRSVMSWIDISTDVCWVLFFAGLIIYFIHLCDRAEQQALKIRVLLCDLLPAAVAEPVERWTFRMALHCDTLMLNRLMFAPLGVVELNKPLLTSVISFVTSCLVIIIQYQMSTQEDYVQKQT